MKELTSVERYALTLIEHYEGDWKREQLAAADAEIAAQRREFDARKLEELAENLGDASSTVSDAEESDESENDSNGIIKSPR